MGEDEDEGRGSVWRKGDSVEAGRAAIDKWRRDEAGGLLHAHVRLMGSGAVAGAAAVPNEGGGRGRGRGVRVPYRLQAQARAQAEAGEAGEAQDERVIYIQHCTRRQHPPQAHVCT